MMMRKKSGKEDEVEGGSWLSGSVATQTQNVRRVLIVRMPARWALAQTTSGARRKQGGRSFGPMAFMICALVPITFNFIGTDLARIRMNIKHHFLFNAIQLSNHFKYVTLIAVEARDTDHMAETEAKVHVYCRSLGGHHSF